MALYLGKDKIAGNFVDSRIGDTLPIGTIVEYDGTEVPVNWEQIEEDVTVNIPEIIQDDILLTELDDGLYKCTYKNMYGSPEEEAEAFIKATTYQYCYLYKQHPDTSITGTILGAKYQPFSVRLIRTSGDVYISVDSQGMSTSYLTSGPVLKKVSEEITFTIGDTSYDALRGMSWGEWVSSEYNTDGFYIQETTRQLLDANNAGIYYPKEDNIFLYAEDIVASTGVYYINSSSPTPV